MGSVCVFFVTNLAFDSNENQNGLVPIVYGAGGRSCVDRRRLNVELVSRSQDCLFLSVSLSYEGGSVSGRPPWE